MSRRLWLLLCEFLIIRKIVSFATYLICLTGLDKAFNKTSILWHKVPKFWRHVAINMAVGLGIALLLVSMHGTPWLTDIEDAGIDWVMRINRGTHTQVNAKPFAFLEIDETTYRYWGEPFHAPREDIKTLIEFARTGNPAIIFVDIELANPGSSPESDALLGEYIANYPIDAPPLVLVRTFRPSLEKKGFLEQRQSFLNLYVQNNKNVSWASTSFLRDNDHSIRRWDLWLPSINKDGELEVVPSVQLMVASLLQNHGDTPTDISQRVNNLILPLVNQNLDASKILTSLDPSEKQQSTKRVKIGPLSLDLSPTPLQQKIIFSIPWSYEHGERPPLVQLSKNKRVPLISVRSAKPIITGSGNVDSSWLDGRITVIGASYSDSRDIHFTPLGAMPGGMILINAINSLLQNGEINPPSTWIKMTVEALLILIMSIAFALFSSFWGMVISGFVVIVAILPLSFLFFRQGVWLDFAIPLIAVQLHQMASEFETKVKEKNTKRKVLKRS